MRKRVVELGGGGGLGRFQSPEVTQQEKRKREKKKKGNA